MNKLKRNDYFYRIIAYNLLLIIFQIIICIDVYAIENHNIRYKDISLVKNISNTKELPLSWKFTKLILDPEISIDKNETISGNGSLKIKAPGAGSWQTSVPVTPGKKYTFTFVIKTKTPIENNPHANFFSMVRKTGGQGSPSVLWLNDYHMKNHRDWTKICLGTYIPTEGVKELVLLLILNGNKKEVSRTDNSEIWIDNIKIIESDITKISPKNLIVEGKNFIIWNTDSFQSVYKNEPIPTLKELNKDLVIYAAKGEKESIQLVLRTEKRLEKITWDWLDFSGPAKISKGNMKVYREEFISLPVLDKNIQPFLRGGSVPDPLPQEKESVIIEKENSPFFFTVDIPKTALPGRYSNVIMLKNDQQIIARIPISVIVRGFSIPEHPTFDLQSDFPAHLISYYEKGNLEQLMKSYFKNFNEHRTTCAVGVIKSSIDSEIFKERNIKIDDKQFLEVLNLAKDNGWCKRLHLHWNNLAIKNGQYFIHPSIKLFLDEENAILNPEFVKYFKKYMVQFVDLLIKEKCYYNPRIKIADEPNVLDPRQVNFYKNIGKLLKEIAPEISPLSAGYYSMEFLPYYDQWYFPAPVAQFYEKEMALAKKKNSKQIYANNMVSPILPPLRMRLFFWGLWKEGYTGLYWWQINGWGYYVRKKDPISGNLKFEFFKNDPWKDDFTTKGVVLIYPPRVEKGESGPVNSLRWEAMRKGMEDFEYLNLLDTLIRQKQGVVSSKKILKAKNALKRVEELVDHLPLIPGSACFNDHFHTYDTRLVDEVKQEIAEAIESLKDNKEM